MVNFLKILLCLLLLNSAGCVIPLPDEVSTGHRYSKDALDFLDLPGTTREEVIATLGTPLFESYPTKTLCYEWDQIARAFVIPIAFERSARITHGDLSHWCLFVAYDSKGMICAHAVRKTGVQGVEAACSEWQRNPGAK